MAIDTGGHLWIFCLNVGQGDTTVVVTPESKILIFDALRASKIIRLLEDLGAGADDAIEQIVVSHPHNDHYGGVAGLLNHYRSRVRGLTLTSLRRVEDTTAGYNSIINTAVEQQIPLHFQAGYSQFFPDQNPVVAPKALRVELLGPSNQFIEQLYHAGTLNTNHYSIIARLNWDRFRMVIAGDAQMETWAHYDSEQMLDDSCTVLRAAHHGSANGTQFERIDRLSPSVIVVSSDPDGKDDIPDLIGSAAFLRYAERAAQPVIALLDNQVGAKTGSVKIDVAPSGRFELLRYGERKEDTIDLQSGMLLDAPTNPTDWRALAQAKMG